MTRFSDNIESGIQGLTSAQSSKASVMLTRVHRFVGGGNQTWSTLLPWGSQCLDAKLFISVNGSAATTDRMTSTSSAGATALGTISSIGSAAGVLRVTTVGLGTLAMVASACAQVGPRTEGADIPIQVISSSTDTATDYTLELSFRRPLSGVV